MFDVFLNDLMELAKACDFCSSCQDSLIRDRIVVGIRDEETIDKLLEEADLTLQMAIDICRAEEEIRPVPSKSVKTEEGIKAEAPDDYQMLYDESETDPQYDVDYQPKPTRRKNKNQKNKNYFEPEVNIDEETFECDMCAYVGKSLMHLQRHHLNQHSDFKPYQCSYCDRSFAMKVRLTRHIQTVHEKRKPFQCSLCPNAFAKNSSLQLHIRAVHDKLKPFSCETCGAKFSQGGHLNRHRMIVHENLRRFKCDYCDKRCASQSDLNMHVKNNHKELKCGACEKVFDKKQDLRYHMLMEHQFVKPHLCETCGKGFMTQCALNTHLTKEHGHPETPCNCRSCASKANCSMMSEEDAKRLEAFDGDAKDHRRPHLCELCGKSYTQLPGLKYHMQSVHGVSDKLCKCETCQNEELSLLDKNFKQPHKHRPHKCKLCNGSFTQVNSLTEHIATVHSKEKRFSCELCKAKFSSHKHLGVHIRSIHLGIKPFECEHCHAKFSQLGHRNRHVMVVHQGLKKYGCDMCDKRYASKIDLKHHLKKIHGKVIFFECSLCDAKFDQRKHLMTHIAEVHQTEEGEASAPAGMEAQGMPEIPAP